MTDLNFLIIISVIKRKVMKLYNDIWDDYHALFTEEEKEQVTIIKTDYKMGFKDYLIPRSLIFLTCLECFACFLRQRVMLK